MTLSLSIRDSSRLKDASRNESESLTPGRHAVLWKEATKRFGVKGCWFKDDKGVVVCSDGTKNKITTMTVTDYVS